MVNRLFIIPCGVVCLLVFLTTYKVSYAAEPADQLSFVNSEVNSNTNIHFSRYYCTECHIKEKRQWRMRFKDYSETCRCHNYTPETYTHPVGIKLSAEKKAKIPPEFPLKDGTITCATCHIMTLQCQTDSSTKKFNKSFLRGNPLLSRTAICYRCHSEVKYKMMDPHKQLDSQGNIVKAKCLYCHKKAPDVNMATLGSSKSQADLVAPIGKLDVLCYRCHYKKTRLHPINANHLKVPSKRILKNIRRSTRKLRITMPLDSQGKITCVTCHNPHERGVIPKDKIGAGGAGEIGRLRVPRAGDRICKACHQN